MWSALLADSEAKSGWVFEPAGRLLVAVTPWPEYGATGTPVWAVKVLRPFNGKEPTRRYWVRWSSRLNRWVGGKEAARMQRDLTPEELIELGSHMRDVLEGPLC